MASRTHLAQHEEYPRRNHAAPSLNPAPCTLHHAPYILHPKDTFHTVALPVQSPLDSYAPYIEHEEDPRRNPTAAVARAGWCLPALLSRSAPLPLPVLPALLFRSAAGRTLQSMRKTPDATTERERQGERDSEIEAIERQQVTSPGSSTLASLARTLHSMRSTPDATTPPPPDATLCTQSSPAFSRSTLRTERQTSISHQSGL